MRCKASRGARRLPSPNTTPRVSASAGTGAADSTPPLALLRQECSEGAREGRRKHGAFKAQALRQATRGAGAVHEALRPKGKVPRVRS